MPIYKSRTMCKIKHLKHFTSRAAELLGHARLVTLVVHQLFDDLNKSNYLFSWQTFRLKSTPVYHTENTEIVTND